MNTSVFSAFRPVPAIRDASVSPQDVAAGLCYLKPTGQHPVNYAFPPPSGMPWESCEFETRMMPILDARFAESTPSLDREGFALWDAPTSVRNFRDDDEVRRVYYEEARELALLATGGSDAFVFDHLVRIRAQDRPSLSFGRAMGGPPSANGRIHNDYTEESGRRRLGLVLPHPAVSGWVRRYCIVNVWRSIRGPILDTPLAVCDARTVMPADLVTSEVRYPNRTGEIYFTTHSSLHRWSYFSYMDRPEALVFKQYDSLMTGVARFTPHAAFDLPDVPVDAPYRESIELRALVVFDSER